MNTNEIKAGQNLVNVLPSGTRLPVVAIEDIGDGMWRVTEARNWGKASVKQLIARGKTYGCPVANLSAA